MKKIFSANDVSEAHLVKGLLEQQGIAAELDGYYLQGAFGELPVIDMISLRVTESDIAQAEQVVTDYLENRCSVSEEELTEAAMSHQAEE